MDKRRAEKSSSVEKVYVDAEGHVHFVSSGTDKFSPAKRHQVQASAPKLSENVPTASWLVESGKCCTSYPIPLTLVRGRSGKIIQRITGVQSVFEWGLRGPGRLVACWMDPRHGDFVPHFELRDVPGERLQAEWDDRVSESHPAWVAGLEDDPGLSSK